MTYWYEDVKYTTTWPDEFFKIFDLYPIDIKVDSFSKKQNTITNTFWKEEEDKDIFELYIPGYSKEDVSIILKVETNKEKNIKIVYSKETTDENIYSLNITDNYEEPTEATVKDGVLTIEFYKKKPKELKEYKLKIN